MTYKPKKIVNVASTTELQKRILSTLKWTGNRTGMERDKIVEEIDGVRGTVFYNLVSLKKTGLVKKYHWRDTFSNNPKGRPKTMWYITDKGKDWLFEIKLWGL